ncbi:MAG TPA: DapH/DapD/GlmU-related protein [Acidimicrobiales bacterium]|nr:DapH/DapD/GlmU-related protein [Acidimicrobiales bacterium]
MTTLEHDWFPGTVPDNVEIGPDGWFHSTFAFRHYRSRRPRGLVIGANCGIYIGTLFDLGPDGEVEIGPTSTCTGPIFATNNRIELGERCLVSALVVLADEPCATPPVADEPTAPPSEPRPVVISMGDDCWVGMGATLLAGAHLGAGVIVGAGTVVDFAVPDGAVVVGNPARILPGKGTA